MASTEEITMTPDQCFNEMAITLGLPKDTGYIDILEAMKNLKKKNEQWEEWSRLVIWEIPGQNTIDVLIEAGLVVRDEDCACFAKLPEDSE